MEKKKNFRTIFVLCVLVVEVKGVRGWSGERVSQLSGVDYRDGSVLGNRHN